MTSTSITTPRQPWLLVAGWSVFVSVVALWPLWVGLFTIDDGKALHLRDMFVAHDMALNWLALGRGDGAPRNIPQDTILAALTPTIPGVPLASGLVLAAAVMGSLCAARLAAIAMNTTVASPSSSTATHGTATSSLTAASTPTWSITTQLAAALFIVWNPFTIERFLQGQWSINIAAMLLPTIAYATLHRRRALWLIAFVLAAITPTGAVLAAITAAVFARGLLGRLAAIGAFAVVACPWVLAAALNPHGGASSLSHARSAALFAAGSEPGVGTLGALLRLGGIWNVDAHAPSASALWNITSLVFIGLLALGVPALWRQSRRVVILTGCAVAIPALCATPWGVGLMGWVISTIPGAGILRDTQKFVCLAIPGYVMLIGIVLESVFGDPAQRTGEPTPHTDQQPAPRSARRNRLRSALRCTLRLELPAALRPALPPALQPALRPAAATAIMALTVLSVPAYPMDIAPLRPQPLSPAWKQIVHAMNAHPNGATLLLPPGNYQHRSEFPAITPALKLLPGQPLDPGFLIVDGQIVDGNPTTMRLLSALLHGGAETNRNGIQGTHPSQGQSAPYGTSGATGRVGTDLPQMLTNAGVDWVLIDQKSGASTDLSAARRVLEDAGYPIVVNQDGYLLYSVTAPRQRLALPAIPQHTHQRHTPTNGTHPPATPPASVTAPANN